GLRGDAGERRPLPTVSTTGPRLARLATDRVATPRGTELHSGDRMFSSSACSTSSDALLLRPARGRERVASFAEGERLAGRYLVMGPIGAGGMGTVYEAFDEATGQIVAIKVLKRPETQDHVRRFEREAASARAVRHPHLCQVHDLGMAKGRAFIVMERLSGE